MVRNVTDVDDDILRKARELGVHYLDLAAEEMARFDADMARSRLLPGVRGAPGHLGHPRDPVPRRRGPRARPRLPGGRGCLLRRVQLRPVRQVSQLGRAEMLAAGGRARRATRRPEQARPARLRALAAVACPTSRRGSRVGVRAGRGGTSSARPWPCASWATTIDIHGGGRDLIFPHHECEAAQSEVGDGTALRPALGARRPGRLGGHQDVQVAGQPGVRERPAEGVGGPGGPPGPPRAPLPARLGVVERTWRPPATAWPVGVPRPRPQCRPGGTAEVGDPALDDVRHHLDDDLDAPGALAAVDADGGRRPPVSLSGRPPGRYPVSARSGTTLDRRPGRAARNPGSPAPTTR